MNRGCMVSMKHLLVLALMAQAVTATEAYAQANITESKSTAAVFVDAEMGSDQNSGVIVSPPYAASGRELGT